MSKIKADSLSIFIEIDKFIIRPNYKETFLKENEDVDVVYLQKNDYLVNSKEIWLVSSTLEEYSNMSHKTLTTRKNYFKLYESSDISLIEDKLSKLLIEKEPEKEKEELIEVKCESKEVDENVKLVYDMPSSPNPLVVETENSLDKVKKEKISKPKIKESESKEIKKEEIKSKFKTKK